MSERKFKRILAVPLLATLLACCIQPCRAEDSVAAILKAADAFRLARDAAQIETQVVVNKQGTQDKERRYTVFIRENSQSVVVMRSPAEKGQKVLMLGDDYWLIMPSSQRPVRITPMQKLLGDASTGDIATMTWSNDYAGNIVGTEQCAPDDNRTCLHLSLQKQRKSVSYARVELWLTQTDYQPVRADLYVASEKLAKRATFKLQMIDAKLQVSEMTLTDELQAGRETVIRYLSRTWRHAPDEWFNPMFLTRAEIG